MDTQTSPTSTFKDFLTAFLILFLTGWTGLVIIIFTTLPTLGPRWLFFFLGVVALTGTAIPITYFLNKRFPSTPPAEKYIIIRQAIWFGVYGSSLAWLQMGQVLNSSLALILAGAFIVIELLLRLWERSHWKPN
jgi:hypothetical protein